MHVSDLAPGLRDAMETVANTATPAGRAARENLTARNKEQWKRIFPALAKAVGGEDNFGVARRKLVAGMKTRADKLYGIADEVDIRLTPNMSRILKNPEFKQAIKFANKLRVLEGAKKLPKKELLIPGKIFKTSEMDLVVQGMDDLVTSLYKSAPKVAEKVKAMREEFKDELFGQNPALKAARKAWSGDALNNDAMDKGLRLFADDADFTVDIIRNMGESERAFFKIGTLRAISRKLGSKSDTSDLTKGLFDKPNTREALKLAFGGKKNFEEFMDFIGREQKMFETFKHAVGNSATARRLAQAGDDSAGGKLAGLLGFVGAMATGMRIPPSVGGYAARKGYESVAQAGGRTTRFNALNEAKRQLLQSNDLSKITTPPNALGGLLVAGAPNLPTAGGNALLQSGLLHTRDEYGR